MIYALGSNGAGQLGLGHTDDISRPTPISTTDSTHHGGVKQVAAGGNHTLVLMADGTVYLTGTLGIVGLKKSSTVLQRVQSPNDDDEPTGVFMQVSATWEACIFLRHGSKGSRIEVAGRGSSGELGLGRNVEVADHQVMQDFPPAGIEVIEIASCMAHTVAVLSNGEVYGWGKGRKGQLGEPAEDCWIPRKIEDIPFKAVKAVCGKDFTCIVGESSRGELLVLGPSKADRFGIRASAPKAIPGWKDGAATWGSIFVLVESGKLLGWGRNDHGQLPPPSLPEIEAIAAGSEHLVARTRSGRVLVWGWGEHGNCSLPIDANGDVKGRWNELDVAGPVVGIGAGCATSLIITSERHDGATKESEAG